MARTISESEGGSYRWVMAFLAFFMNTVINFMIFQVGGLAERIMPALHMGPAQLAMVLSVPFLAHAILGIPAGAAADRFGAVRVVIVGAALTVVCGIGRIGASSFEALFVWMLLLGIGPALLNANVAKILGAWFPPRSMGTAMGLYVAGANAGITIALATSALFPSIKAAFVVSAGIAVGAAALWTALARGGPSGRRAKELSGARAPEAPAPTAKAALRAAFKSGNLWIGSAAMFFFMGTFVTQNGFLANALIKGKGVEAVAAGFVASALSVSFIVGTIVGPTLAERAGSTRLFLAPAAVLAAAASYLAWLLPFGPLTWLLLVVAGLALGTAVPLVMSLPMLLPEIGPAFAGSAGGVISSFQMAGAFVISSYVIIPLAGGSLDRVFLYIGLGYLVFALAAALLPELGRRARAKN